MYSTLAASLRIHRPRSVMTRKISPFPYCSLRTLARPGLLHALIAAVGFVSTPVAAHAGAPVDMASLDKRSHCGLPQRTLPPRVREAVEYYEITGSSEKDLQEGIRRKGIPLRDGKVYDSVTRWEIQWDYGHDRSAEACSVEAFRVTVEVTTRYPAWIGTDSAPPALAAKWQIYQQSLLLHESIHRDMVVEAAEDLSRSVENLPPVATCDALDRTVQALSRERIGRLREDSAAYDRDTGHGLTQGAFLQ
jgi:predicted secreted Zn-dependent protease